MNNLNIICLSTQLFSDPMWTNKQQVMSRLSQMGHHVIYVDPQIRVRKFGKNVVLGKYNFKRLVTFTKIINDNLTVFSPVKFLFAPSLEQKIMLWQLKRLSKGMKQVVLWVYDPEFAPIINKIDHSLLIYDCVDDYASFPPSRYKQGKDWIVAQEQKLIKEADLVFATSKELYETRKKINSNTFYTANAADYNLMSTALREDLPIPADIDCLKRPIIGFQGALANYKVDLNLIEKLAKVHPEYSIVLIGPKAPVDPGTDLSKLKAIPNIFFLGVKPYSSLPAYLKAFDVAMMPALINEYNLYSFPLKFFEYLGAGKIIVSTKLPALAEFYNQKVAFFADNQDEFIELIEKALKANPQDNLDKRLLLAKEYSWDNKTARMLQIVEQKLMEKYAA